MKILFISSLPETNSGGPKHSVPKQVNAQANCDEVFWINITPWGIDETNIPCECILDIGKVVDRIMNILPDLVIFEDFYYFDFCRIGRFLWKEKIPYIIVPRGSMTHIAQKQKCLKKIPANILMFNSFSRKALAIEYLTEAEKNNSGARWNKNALIVPNGTDARLIHSKPSFSKNIVRGVFIGRIEFFQKGLDVFIDVCGDLRSLLTEKNVRIDLYGPCSDVTRSKISFMLKEYNLEDIIHLHSETHGEEKMNILLNSDFFILTSRFEGLPMGLLEALSYGLPCLITDETNIGKEIEMFGAGYSSPFNKEEIERNFERILGMNDEDAKEMSQNSIAFAKKYNWDVIAEAAHDSYSKLI